MYPCTDFFKSSFLSLFSSMSFSSKQDGTNYMLRNSLCTHIHTGTHFTHICTGDRARQKAQMLWKMYSTQSKHLQHQIYKEEINLWLCVGKKKKIVPKPREHSISRSFQGCKARVKKKKRSHVRSSKVCLSLLKCQCPLITKSLPQLIKVNVTESYGLRLIH